MPRFRGRGLIQLTGRANYTGYGTWRGNNYTVDPNPPLLAGDAFTSTDVSFNYWVSKNYRGLNINRHAEAGNGDAATEQVTRAVNGGTTHMENRREYFGYVLRVLNDKLILPDTATLQRQLED